VIRATIAVCTRNRAGLLQRCLASLDTQVVDTDEIEVLVVDNGSTDQTSEVLRSWQRDGDLRRAVREPRVGLSNARNTALAVSDREVVIFVDDDALTPPLFGQAHLAAYESAASVGTVGGPVGLTWPAGRPRWIIDELTEWYSALDLGDAAGPYPNPHGPFGTNMSVWRTAAIDVGGFDPRFGRRRRSLLSGEERDLTRRLVKEGWAIRYAPAAAVIQQVLPERLTRRWLLRRGWAQGISNARFEVLAQSLPPRHRLGHAFAEIRTSAEMFARRRADDRDELLVLTRVLAHAAAALEFARLSMVPVHGLR
jgi:glycosyltransferase involved in cell wall biosynthesis